MDSEISGPAAEARTENRVDRVRVGKEVDRFLTLLRNKIREKGFTQLEVQKSLSWGRSYISQLLTKQKALRVEQVLYVLDVVGVEPAEFFQELYHFRYGGFSAASRPASPYGRRPSQGLNERHARSFDEMRILLRGLVKILSARSIIGDDELAAAVEACKGESDL